MSPMDIIGCGIFALVIVIIVGCFWIGYTLPDDTPPCL